MTESLRTCLYCGDSFLYRYKPGRPPTTCSDEHRRALACRRTALWQKANPEQTKRNRAATWAKYYAKHREHLIAQNVEYARAHPEWKSARDSARYAMSRGAPSAERFTLDEIFDRDNAICHLCDLIVERKHATIDHIVPVVHSGPHTRANVALAHRSCNSSRKTMPVEEYRARLAKRRQGVTHAA